MKSRFRAVMTLALLPFFEYFRTGNPHQLAAIKQLEDEIPKELLAEDAAWFEAWKESGISQRAFVPYFHQLDDPHEGHRSCFTASAAMVAAMYGVVHDYQQYKRVREKFGDTTLIEAQVKALRSLGLHAEFRNDADDALVEAEIASGRPVIAGILHRGNFLRGEPAMCDSVGCGHYVVIVGFDKDNWIVHDPRGSLDVERGGHFSQYGGKNLKVPRAGFRQRWQVEGEGSGWVVLVDDEI